MIVLTAADVLLAQPKRVLYVTHSAGFRHGSIPISIDTRRSLAATSGKLEIVATEDVSLLNATTLHDFDAVFFFTSGEKNIRKDPDGTSADGSAGINYTPGPGSPDAAAVAAFMKSKYNFDAGGLVLTAFGRINGGNVRGDQALAERFLNLFYRI